MDGHLSAQTMQVEQEAEDAPGLRRPNALSPALSHARLGYPVVPCVPRRRSTSGATAVSSACRCSRRPSLPRGWSTGLTNYVGQALRHDLSSVRPVAPQSDVLASGAEGREMKVTP